MARKPLEHVDEQHRKGDPQRQVASPYGKAHRHGLAAVPFARHDHRFTVPPRHGDLARAEPEHATLRNIEIAQLDPAGEWMVDDHLTEERCFAPRRQRKWAAGAAWIQIESVRPRRLRR